MNNILRPLRRVRSFVRRDGRMTDAQKRALEMVWPRVGLDIKAGQINLDSIFGRKAPCVLEIGFGSGHSLLQMAKSHPHENFIGIETHLPGIGSLLQGIDAMELKNVRVYYHDAVEVLTHAIPNDSLEGVQIFFPDPWPKRKHHKRRLIQPVFMQLVLNKLKENGTLHLATDWQEYAAHMMKVLSPISQLKNLSGINQYAGRSVNRPLITKFERRGIESGRAVWELQFIKEIFSTKY
ncbi:MAG: tRNA (guanine-N(7)-)-methyltransferase [uncultured bacterium]|nr:MAG: tRNA (guanine-N(7)-)-methyltransferase [uncultured bacterium]